MASSWARIDSKYHFAKNGWDGVIDPQRPTAGLTISQHETKLASIFQLADPRLIGDREFEAYLRQDDLQILFPESDGFPIEISLVWRLLDWQNFRRDFDVVSHGFGPQVLVEMLLSMRTQLLDAEPVRELLTECFGADTFYPEKAEWRREMQAEGRQNDHYSLFSWPENAAIALAYPSDLRWQAIQVVGQKKLQCQMHLRADNLEKGVIRRMRFLFAIVSCEQKGLLKSIPEMFATSELPLSV